tara:strand:- start:37862 stop:38785 length:924 start_codon:yes stop_codon:yes gene_type:complete
MVDYKKTKVDELRSLLISGGFQEDKLNNLTKKELVEMHKEMTLAESIDDINLESDFEEIPDGLPGTDSPDAVAEKPEDSPSILSSEWHDYVMSQFKPNELVDGNPITAGLRRVVEVVLGEITSTGPTQVFPAQDPNGPGRATVVYEVVIREYETGSLKRYADTADVWHGNTDDLFCAHPVATASTRAEGRALRKALKLRVLAAEELAKKDIVSIVQQTVPGSPTDGDWNPEEKISVQQVSFIDTKCRQLDISGMDFVNSGTDKYSSITDVTKEVASKMIKQLNKYQNGESEIPENISGYVSNWRHEQ